MTIEPLRVLILEDDPDDAELVMHVLSRSGLVVTSERVDTREAFVERLDWPPQVILADYSIPGFDGIEALNELTRRGLDIPFIFVSGTISEESAVTAIKLGASDYLLKDRLTRLELAVRQAIDAQRLRVERAREHEALQESETRFRLLADNAGDIIYYVDLVADPMLTYVSPSVHDVLDIEGQELLRSPAAFADGVDDDDLARLLVAFRDPVHERDSIVTRFVRPDGTVVWLEHRCRQLRADGAIVGVEGVARDVTERVMATRELEIRVKAAALEGDILAEIAHEKDPAIMLQRCAQTIARHLPVDVAAIWTTWPEHEPELVAFATAPDAASIGPSGMDDVYRVVAKVLTDPAVRIEKLVRDEDPSNDLHYAVFPLTTQNGTVGAIGLIAAAPILPSCRAMMIPVAGEIVIGVTRNNEERARRESELRFREITDHLTQVCWLMEFDDTQPHNTGHISYINSACEEIYGLPVESMLEGAWMDLLHDDDRETVLTALARLSLGESTDIEYRIHHPSGSTRWIRDQATPICDEAGTLVRVVGLAEDITAPRQAAEQLRAAYEHQVIVTEELRRANEIKDEFLRTVSHELRTPLTSVIGFAELLRSGLLADHEVSQATDRLSLQAQKLERLVTDLLDLDRLQRGEATPRRRDVSLRQLVRNTLETLDTDGHPLAVDTPDLSTWIDAAQIERIIENLLVNAFRHTPEGTDVRLVLDVEDTSLLITVADTGPGIPPEMREEIFRPFRHVDPDSPQPGPGVGLALVRCFAELHGGEATVTSGPGSGSRFVVKIAEAVQPEAAMEVLLDASVA